MLYFHRSDRDAELSQPGLSARCQCLTDPGIVVSAALDKKD
jgi:hypothetical protein